MPKIKPVHNGKKPTYLIEFPNMEMRNNFKVHCAKHGASMKERILELIQEDLEKGKE